MNNDYTLELSLPSWISSFLNSIESDYSMLQSRVKLAITLSQLNVTHRTGGPFGAAIFDRKTYRLISVGVNRVVPENCSVAHAEIMAIALAQKELKKFDLSFDGADYELVSSAQPCAMCFGAIIWSGVKKIVYAATATDVETIVGFDEGPLIDNWKEQLEKRGVSIEEAILRKEAIRVLEQYKESGERVYNSQRQENME